jgi:uncharacterized damage-inducible protein DinB
MKMRPRQTLSLALSLALTSLAVAAHAAAPEAAPKGAFQSDVLGQFDDASKKVLALEEAVPQNKFTWRPAPGVRSISEAYLHIAFGNYAVIKFATGKEPPADAGWEMNPDKWDKKTTKKEEIKAILEKSMEHVRVSVKALPDADLDRKFNFFGNEITVRAGLIALVGHTNEHLGQSVAYARANKVVPPWSKKEAAKEAKEAMKPTAAAAPAAPAMAPAAAPKTATKDK